MLNKAGEERFKSKLNAKLTAMKETNSKLYNGWDIGDTERESFNYKGVLYIIRNAHRRVIDDYDEALASVELSHHEALGYRMIESETPDAEVLDFRFAKPEDYITVEDDQKAKLVYLKSSNVRYAEAYAPSMAKYDITLDTNIPDLVISTRIFLKTNKECISGMNFQGVENNTIKDLLTKMCNKYGVTDVTFIITDYNKKATEVEESKTR